MGVEAGGWWGCRKTARLGSSGLGEGRGGEETREADSSGEKKGKFKPPFKTYRKNEEAELLPIVQYSPSLHNNVE